MSRCVVDSRKFSHFLRQATYLPIGKNKVRKELLSMLSECVELHFDCGAPDFTVPSSLHDSIVSFLNKDGRGENLKDDELLSFVTSITQLTKAYADWHHDLHLPSTRATSPVERKVQASQASSSETS